MVSNDQMSKPSNSATRSRRRFWPKALIGVIAVFLAWFLFLRQVPIELSPEDQAQLLALAREQLIASVAGEDLIPLEADDVTVRTQRQGAAFVSLIIDGKLRGCMIDQFEPHEPLFVNVLHNVQLAVGTDARFPSIMQHEIDDVLIKVSIVHEIKHVSFRSPDELLERLAQQRNGVILDVEGELAAYLPYVWDVFSDPNIFLEKLCIKAGWEADRWSTEPHPTVRTFKVYEFGESG